MTTLYFLRHAEAHLIQPGQTDLSRRLTSKGQEQARTVGICCGRLNIVPNFLWVSPYQRTLETAEMMLQGLSDFTQNLPKIEPTEWLAIGAEQHNSCQHFQNLRLPEILFLVSHEPNCSTLIAQILGTNNTAIHVKKASLTAIRLSRFPTPSGCLLWSLTPQLIQYIAKS